MIKVLDSHALMVFLEKEPGYEKMQQIFVQAAEKDNHLLMTSVNFGEIYYIVLRECGKEKTEEVEKVIASLPIHIVDVNIELAKEAGKLKAINKMSYADCFAAALAKVNKGELITGDKEFKQVESVLKIHWLE
ncbi:MAG: type II toxin-antitoxin system VapC family toxin [Elusimicrobia bacterium]|nr:type II toxin-antitoxin system VapC family toxin [Candidatus Liberimonas magnetica]